MNKLLLLLLLSNFPFLVTAEEEPKQLHEETDWKARQQRRHQDFSKLPQEEQERIRRRRERFRKLPPEKRRRLKERFRRLEHLTPEERRRRIRKVKQRRRKLREVQDIQADAPKA